MATKKQAKKKPAFPKQVYGWFYADSYSVTITDRLELVPNNAETAIYELVDIRYKRVEHSVE